MTEHKCEECGDPFDPQDDDSPSDEWCAGCFEDLMRCPCCE